jgi:hypothetical protein
MDDSALIRSVAHEVLKYEPSVHYNCSGYLRLVAEGLDVNDNNLFGSSAMAVQANEQVVGLRNSSQWVNLGKGEEGKDAAVRRVRAGQFVVAGYRNPTGHGHVAVVVDGPLVNGWPRGYWGMMGGQPGRDRGLRESFSASKRTEVEFFARNLPEHSK